MLPALEELGAFDLDDKQASSLRISASLLDRCKKSPTLLVRFFAPRLSARSMMPLLLLLPLMIIIIILACQAEGRRLLSCGVVSFKLMPLPVVQDRSSISGEDVAEATTVSEKQTASALTFSDH